MSTNQTLNFGPVGETPNAISAERAFIEGSSVGAFTFGIELCLYVRIAVLLMRGLYDEKMSSTLPTSSAMSVRSIRKRTCGFFPSFKMHRTKWMLLYITALFVVSMIFQLTNMVWVDEAFVDNRNFPGGPVAFSDANVTDPTSMVNNIAFLVTSWLSDGLLLWRCTVLWKASSSGRRYMFVMALPFLMYLALVAISIFFLFLVSHDKWPAITRLLFFGLYIASVAFDILITSLIVLRLLLHSRAIKRVLGKSFSQRYHEIAGVVTESALMVSLMSIAVVVTVFTESPWMFLFLDNFPQIQVIAAYLIMARVLNGTAATMNTTAAATASISRSTSSATRLSTVYAGSMYRSRSSHHGHFQEDMEMPPFTKDLELARDDFMHKTAGTMRVVSFIAPKEDPDVPHSPFSLRQGAAF